VRNRTLIAITAGIVATGVALVLGLSADPTSPQARARAMQSPPHDAPRSAILGAPDNDSAPAADHDAADAADTATAGPRVETVVTLPWGEAPGQVGHKIPEEGAPEGPMSFYVAEDGRVLVLDQVNSRVQVLDPGQPPAVIDLPADTYQDLGVTGDGDVVVMDRLSRRSIETWGPDGRLLASAGIEGPGVDEGGGVTGLFQRPDGTWIEVEHQRVVRVASSSGKPDPDRPVLPGRFSADGTTLLMTAKESAATAVVLGRPAVAPDALPVLIARVPFDLPLAYLVALESDPAGRIYLAAVLIQPNPAGPQLTGAAFEEIVVLAPGGQELGRARLPASLGPEEQFRPVRLGADGQLYLMRCEPDGARLGRLVL
jgi:hypothetical protein